MTTATDVILRPPTVQMVQETLQRELARTQQELDTWINRRNAARVVLGVESPVTAACEQMVTFWMELRRTALAAVAKANRPISTLRLSAETP